MAPPSAASDLQFSPREKGVVWVILGLLLVVDAAYLLISGAPDQGHSYNHWVLLFTVLNAVIGYGLICSGVWKFVATSSKVATVVWLVVGGLVAAFAFFVVYDNTVNRHANY